MFRPVAPSLVLFALAACQTKPTEAPVPAAPPAPIAPPPAAPSSHPSTPSEDTQADWSTGPVHRGGSFTVEVETQLVELIGKPDDYQGKRVKVTGQVTRACSKKGCWMELRANPEQAGLRVTFEDYGFFVPLDSAGATAVVEGTVKVEHLAADHVEHLKAEGARISADEKGEAKEIGIIATAVRLEKAAPAAAQ